MPMNDDHARFMDLGFEPRRSPPAPKRITEAPATPQQEQAYVDEFLVRDPTTALTARQASATKLDALCRKARILRAASSGSQSLRRRR